jgi:hypothetical protein
VNQGGDLSLDDWIESMKKPGSKALRVGRRSTPKEKYLITKNSLEYYSEILTRAENPQILIHWFCTAALAALGKTTPLRRLPQIILSLSESHILPLGLSEKMHTMECGHPGMK